MTDNRQRESNEVVQGHVFKDQTVHFVCKYCKEVYKSVPEFINHKITKHDDVLPKHLSRVPRQVPAQLPIQDTPGTKQNQDGMADQKTMEVETSSTGSSDSDSDLLCEDDDDFTITSGNDDDDVICTNTTQENRPKETISTNEDNQDGMTSTQDGHHEFTKRAKEIDHTEPTSTTEDQLEATTSTKEDGHEVASSITDETEMIPTNDDGGQMTADGDYVPPSTDEGMITTEDVGLTYPEENYIELKPSTIAGDEMVMSPEEDQAQSTSNPTKIKFAFNRIISENNSASRSALPSDTVQSTENVSYEHDLADPNVSKTAPNSPTKKAKKRRSLNGYRCPFCAKIFNYKNALEQHEFIHTRPFTCPYCNKGWPSNSALQRHISRIHDPSKAKLKPPGPTEETEGRIFRCGECPFTTKQQCSLYQHRKDHGTNHKNKCTACTCTYTTLAGLRRHIYRVHPSLSQEIKDSKKKTKVRKFESAKVIDRNLIPCVVCLKPVNTLRMTSHRKLYHPEVKLYYCRLCPFTSNAHCTIWNHKKCHTIPNKFKCPECTASYSTLAKVNYHIRMAHPSCATLKSPKKKAEGGTGKKSAGEVEIRHEFKCSFCSKTFRCDSDLERHEGIHTKPFHCSTCPRRFSDQYQLKHHMKKGHRMNRLQRRQLSKKNGNNNKSWTPEPKQCPVCDQMIIGGKPKLSSHLKLYHPKYEAHQCPECPFRTANEKRLHRHALIHQAADIFKCGHCTASFGNLANRERHILEVHPNATSDPQTSEFCLTPRKAASHPTGYYKVDENLDLGREHNGIKEKCRICRETFPTRSTYEFHFAQKHPDFKPYKCDECPYVCKQYAKLTAHEKLHTEQNEFKCEFCSASFENVRSKKIHLKTVHKVSVSAGTDDVSKDESFEDISSPLSPSLEPKVVIDQMISPQKSQHQSPAASSPFKCSECPKTFSLNMALKVHQRSFHSSLFKNEELK